MRVNALTARKLAVLVYRMLMGDLVYVDPGASAYDAHHRQRILRGMRKHVAQMGFGLVDLATGDVIAAAVS